MYQQVVPRNNLQQQLLNNQQELLAPDPFAVMQAPCIISKLYDAESISEEGVSVELGVLLASRPGWLFARVTMPSGQSLILPFKDPEELIYTVYGNSVQLEGRAATVCYSNNNIQNGSITLDRTRKEAHLSLSKQSDTFDIGAIL